MIRSTKNLLNISGWIVLSYLMGVIKIPLSRLNERFNHSEQYFLVTGEPSLKMVC